MPHRDDSARETNDRAAQPPIADIAHELRSPLTVIRGYLELLAKPLEPVATEYARQAALRAVERMDALIDDLSFSELALLGERAPVHVNLSALAQEVAEEYRVASGREITCDVDTGVAVSGDPARLRQVLANLLANAVKYSPAESAIQVLVNRADGKALMQIIDGGPGIAPDDRERAFDRRERLGADPAIGGQGLGLAIARAIARAHSGDLMVTDREDGGSGARFVLTLPEN